MRWLTLYLRSRRVPMALAMLTGCVVLMWALWNVFSETRDAGVQMVILTVLLAVATVTATLAGPDDALEGTGALPRSGRRAAHLLVALTITVLLLLATLLTEARFGPVSLVIRDAAGLLGLTALGAVTVGADRAWFVPLVWTLAAVVFPLTDSTWGRILTWQVQEPGNNAATLTAGLFAVIGLLAYTVVGPARRAPAEAPL